MQPVKYVREKTDLIYISYCLHHLVIPTGENVIIGCYILQIEVKSVRQFSPGIVQPKTESQIRSEVGG